MNKKQRLLQLFEELEWLPTLNGSVQKVLTYDDFARIDFDRTMEYGEKYNDIIYAKSIFKKLGYHVFIGMVFHVVKPKPKPSSISFINSMASAHSTLLIGIIEITPLV